jgi:hypothetical protein
MKLGLYLLQVIMLFFFLIACKPSKSVKYSFFAAGHVYGNPMDKEHPKGLYKPFKEKIQTLNDDKKAAICEILDEAMGF